jgi:hypothetical protein
MTRANPKKGRLTPIEIIVIMVCLVFIVTVGVGGIMEATAHNDNEVEKTKVADFIYKVCDGNNLIYTYTGEGIAVSPHDPQCQ